MSGPHADEYRALRHVIAQRGTARVWMLWAGVAAWAVVATAVLAWLPYPVAASLPLVVLASTFEAARGLHLGVERVGRYLQVFHESPDDSDGGARWEHIAMALGPRVPGAGGHPLGVPVFLVATATNFLAVILPGPTALELGVMLVPHLAFVAWMIVSDRRMRAQRGAELTEFERLRRESSPRPRPQPPVPNP